MVTRPLCDTNMMNHIYCVQINPWTLYGKVFGYNHKEKTQICRFFVCFMHFMHQSCAQMPDFWNKWPWGFCVIPVWWIIYSVNRLTQKPYLVKYLVTIVKKKLKFVDFCLLQFMDPSCIPRCLDFWNKWSWVFCVIPVWWITYSVNKLTHKPYLVKYLVQS